MIELRKMWKRHQLLITGGYILLGTAWLLLIWFFVLSKEAGLSAFIIGFFSALMVIFPASLLCAPIVKRFVNQKIQEFAGLLNSALKIIKGFADDEKNGLEKNSIDFLSSWVLFTGNRWMLTWAMWASTSFFIILSSVLGTILFLEQNKKLGIQNELLSSQNSLAYVETFAEFGKPFRVEKKDFTFPLGLSIGESSCGFDIKFNGTHKLYPVPKK